jgi:O-antigen ligase
MFLQLVGVAIIVWAAIDSGDGPVAPAARQLLALGMIALALVAAQLIPVSAALWRDLGPRAQIARDFSAFSKPLAAEPLSLTPALTLNSMLGIIPPLALFCAMVRLKAYRSVWLAIALIVGTLAGVGLGALQVASSGSDISPWYLYEETNLGKAVGFFANANHMATLLVMTIPFLAAVVASAKRTSIQRYSATLMAAGGLAILLVVGLALNGSLAGYGLALPVVAVSSLIVFPPGRRLRWWIAAFSLLLVIAVIAGLETTAIGEGTLGESATTSVDSRAEILSTTLHAAREFMPFGSGLGSFSHIYPLYENLPQVTGTYVVHAHNDYAEIALELGAPGVLIIVVFLMWWAVRAWRAWATAAASPFGRAAAIASAAVLVHSLVDFPLRTAAIAATFAMCLALLAGSGAALAMDTTDRRPTRHVII